MSENERSLQTRTNWIRQVELYNNPSYQQEKGNLELLEALEKVRSKIARGPTPAFNEAHVIKALEIIANQGTVGRLTLSIKLGLGIGTTRTVLKHLKNEGFIISSKNGFALSEQGEELYSNIQSSISERTLVPKTPIAVGPIVVALLVRNRAHKVGRGIEQRNTAIRAGASGATTLIFFNNKITMPSKKNHELNDLSKIQDIIKSKLTPKENDVIIFGSGMDKINAEIGALMASLKLLET
jgi:predicted transcriptional regulator